jgi:hypothetical protein
VRTTQPAEGCSGLLVEVDVALDSRDALIVEDFFISGARLITVRVTTYPTADRLAGQVTDAFPWDKAPRYLIRDRDCAYGHVYIRRVRAIGIHDRPTAPCSPWQNGYVERLIESIRRESLDNFIVFGEALCAGSSNRIPGYYY